MANGARYNLHTYQAEAPQPEAPSGDASGRAQKQTRPWCVIDLVSPYSARSASAHGFTRICRPAAESEHAAVTALKLATELYGAEVIVSQGASRTKAIVRPQVADEESRANCVRVRLVSLEDSKGALRQRLAALAASDADPYAVKDRQIAALQEENAGLLAQLEAAVKGVALANETAKPAPRWRRWFTRALARRRSAAQGWFENEKPDPGAARRGSR